MKRVLILLLCFFVGKAFAQSFEPVNKNTIPEAKKLLAYLYKINGKNILSGQHNFNSNYRRYSTYAFGYTGEYPVIWGTDFMLQDKKDPGQEVVDEAIQMHKEGFIISLMWHAGPPTQDPPYEWIGGIQSTLTDKQWDDLLTEGTDIHNRWLHQVDNIAGYLKQLQDANVPVLWRPYQEMNGTWFWWGNRPGKQGFAKLWEMMYDRFVNYHHLNNLIWVWDANAPCDTPGREAYDYKDFYPDKKYVDVLAADVYHFDYSQKEYNNLLDLADGKLIALGEVGEMPSITVLKAQPKWVWFMIYANYLQSENSPDKVKDIYEYPPVLSLEEVRDSLK